MRKKILNIYKIKRKVKKKIHRSSAYVLFHSSDDISHKKDFLLKKRQQNPFYKTNIHGLTLRKKIELISLFLLCLTLLAVLLYNPFFRISHININGTQHISNQDIQTTVEGILHTKRWYILPGDSYSMINLQEIQQILLLRYPLTSVTINKVFPNTLNISIQEQISKIIYTNGNIYATASPTGVVVQLLPKINGTEWRLVPHTVTSTTSTPTGSTTTIKIVNEKIYNPNVTKLHKTYGNYPIVYDKYATQIAVHNSVMTQGTAQTIVAWFEALSNMSSPKIPFGYVTINDTIGNATIYTTQGWKIRINLTQPNIQSKILALKTILNQEQINIHRLRYIDLRFSNRVYWK